MRAGACGSRSALAERVSLHPARRSRRGAALALALIRTMRTQKIWRDGHFVDWPDATIHVLSHVVHYGSSVFEGIRC